MLRPFLCGSFNKEDDDQLTNSPSSTPRKSRKNSFCKRQHKDTKNPYSSRGLDKFSALLAELEEQRQKIHSLLGSDDMYAIRFAYSNANEIRPIVIKFKDKEKDKIEKDTLINVKRNDKLHGNNSKKNSGVLDSKIPVEPPLEIVKNVKQDGTILDNKSKKQFSWNKSFFTLCSRPDHYYLPMVFIIILLFLAAFGRSSAIICTTIAWYMIPTLQESSHIRLSMRKRDSSQVRLSMNKKDYVRRLSEKTLAFDDLSSPRKSSCTGAALKDKFS